jgi:hypothetical protein
MSAAADLDALIADFGQYGDLITTGDTVDRMQRVIVALSDGTLNPANSDLGIDSMNWLCKLIKYLGSKVATPPVIGVSTDLIGYNLYGDAPGMSSVLTFTMTESLGGFFLAFFAGLLEIRFPNLTQIDPLNAQNGGSGITITDNAILKTIDFPLLTTVGAGNNISIQNNGALTAVNLPNFLPGNGQHVIIQSNFLPSAQVNAILARCVANPAFVTGSVGLQQNIPAPPTGQGIADKATLIGRGVSVFTD